MQHCIIMNCIQTHFRTRCMKSSLRSFMFLRRAVSRPSHKVSPHILMWDARCTCSRFVLKCSSMCVWCVLNIQTGYFTWEQEDDLWPLISVEFVFLLSPSGSHSPCRWTFISNTFQDPGTCSGAARVCVRTCHSAGRDNDTKPLWIRLLAPTPVTEEMMKIPSQHLLFSASPSVVLRHWEKRGRNNEKNTSGITYGILDSHLTRSRNVNSSRTSETFHWNIENILLETHCLHLNIFHQNIKHHWNLLVFIWELPTLNVKLKPSAVNEDITLGLCLLCER